jgi:hypothetical protein
MYYNLSISIFLGRLGLSICEDLLFSPPTVSLVEKYNIDTMIFSTEWWDEYPHQIPTALFSAWSKSLQVHKTLEFILFIHVLFLPTTPSSSMGLASTLLLLLATPSHALTLHIAPTPYSC